MIPLLLLILQCRRCYLPCIEQLRKKKSPSRHSDEPKQSRICVLTRTVLLILRRLGKKHWLPFGSIWNHVTMTRQDDNKDCKIQCNVRATRVLDDLSSSSMKEESTNVLVTGSLYLVRSFYTAIEWSEELSPDTTLDL
jgi:hypothetical protein